MSKLTEAEWEMKFEQYNDLCIQAAFCPYECMCFTCQEIRNLEKLLALDDKHHQAPRIR